MNGRKPAVWEVVLGLASPPEPEPPEIVPVLQVPAAPAPRRDSRIVWLVLLVGGFIYEMWGVLNRAAGDTLTEATRAVMGDPSRLRWWLIIAAVIGVGVWFVPHLADPATWGWQQLVAILTGVVIAGILLWMVGT